MKKIEEKNEHLTATVKITATVTTLNSKGIKKKIIIDTGSQIRIMTSNEEILK